MTSSSSSRAEEGSSPLLGLLSRFIQPKQTQQQPQQMQQQNQQNQQLYNGNNSNGLKANPQVAAAPFLAASMTAPPVGAAPMEVVVSHHRSPSTGNFDSRPPPPPPTDDSHRAVHRIRLPALDHNYACVESAANRQRCSVIVVVKADGYGHGAVATALHLADVCGCDAFAVATLEEGIALRNAFVNNPPGRWNKNLAALFHTQTADPSHSQQHHHQAVSSSVQVQHHHHAVQVPSVVNVVSAAAAAAAAAPPPPGGSAAGSAAVAQQQTKYPNNKEVAVPCGGGGVPGGCSGGATATTCAASITTRPSLSSTMMSVATARTMRPSKIRILVLGPPVGFPRCFDDYYHHDIEVMVSGPEVARALMEWVVDEKERKRAQAERAAAQTKAEALLSSGRNVPEPTAAGGGNNGNGNQGKAEAGGGGTAATGGGGGVGGVGGSRANLDLNRIIPAKLPASTLNAVQGQDLVREVRAILMNQNKAATEAAQQQAENDEYPHSNQRSAMTSGVTSAESSVSSGGDRQQINNQQQQLCGNGAGRMTGVGPQGPRPPVQTFGGLEAAAKSSRQREVAAARALSRENSVSNDSLSMQCAAAVAGVGMNANHVSTNGTCTPSVVSAVAPARRLLRWHALVDSGMGRLGFRTEPVKEGEDRMDTVDVIKELVDAEIHNNAPIEFFGMCTHMAEANDTSKYTQTQIAKFISLLKRVRAAGVFIPTLSTDNSAALLTTNLNHFDPKEILSQSHADTRGYVRTGGAIYGQRPAFKQLRAVSTLLASVRHVAVLQKGESVGYDRAYTAPYDVMIATLTIGFADGYPRELGNGIGKVAIRGDVFPTAGNICMDMMMVELGPAEDKSGVGATVAVGDTAVLWGPLDDEEDGGLVKLQDIAATLKTTQSALTCGLDKIRVRRQFV